jgi:AcrR family transcriptional regulator
VAPAGEATRRRLLDTAERLVAERGIDGVTVNEITAASGARNKSAVAYHFGSKLALLEAVLDRHLPGIDARRDELLDQMEATSSVSVRGLCEAVVLPVAAKLDDPSGVRYLKIQAALLGHRDRAALPTTIREPWARPSLVRVGLLTLTVIPDPPTDVPDHLQLLMTSLVFHGLADYADAVDHDDRDRFVATLVDAVVAIFETLVGPPGR